MLVASLQTEVNTKAENNATCTIPSCSSLVLFVYTVSYLARMIKRLSAVKKLINRGPLCKVQYSDSVRNCTGQLTSGPLSLRPQGLLAGTMRHFRAKVNYKSRRALSLLKQTFVRKYHIVPASRPWVHSPRMKGPTLHQQPKLIIYIHVK